MQMLDLEKIKAHQARTFGLPPFRRVASPDEALSFVNERGFIYFWPISGINFPSLWAAVAGDRPVPSEHDDPGHITWGWKDAALNKRIWYYAKVLRRKAMMISLELAPYFYALSENYGSPEDDYLIAYEEGRLPQSARLVYEAILDNGPLNTIDLRKAAKLTNAKDSEFNKALEMLQADFKLLPVGVAEAGAWKYAFIYDIPARYYPKLPEQARQIGEAEARERLLETYFATMGAASLRDAEKLFRWGKDLTERSLRRLVTKGKLLGGLAHPSQKGEWLVLPDLL